MRKTLCRPGKPGIHLWREQPILRRIGLGWPWSRLGRLIVVGYTYLCERCNERGYAA